MTATCGSLAKGRVMRLVTVDACGNPVLGAGAQLVTKGFIKNAVTPDYLAGTEYLQRNADDELCVNDLSPNSLKRARCVIDWCVVDPDALVMITGETQITTGSPATGTGLLFDESQLTNHFSLEMWQPATGDAACAGGTQLYGYWFFPNLRNPKINAFNIENATLTLQIECDTARAASTWGHGPGTGTKWLPSSVDAVISGKHYGFNWTTTPPPTPPAVCGAFALS